MESYGFPRLFYSIFLLLILHQTGPCLTELLFLQSVFRHGDRAPTHLYPNDPNSKDAFPNGLGKLTQLGKKQHYVFGKFLRSFYSDFITSNPNEVFVNSTSKDRCLSSAECHLAGLYEPSPEWQFQPGYLWQPIPVHYRNHHIDKYLNPKAKCPKAKEEAKRIYHSQPYSKFEEENEPMLKNLSSCAGEKLSRKKAARLSTTLKIEREYNLTIPSCFLPYFDQLERFADITHNIIYEYPKIQRFRAGPLLGRIIDNMKSKIKGDLPDQKVHVYSARDRNVVVIQAALGVFAGKKPPYAGTLIFELHSPSGDDSHTVRLLFFNSTRPQDGEQTPNVLQLPGCAEYCPLEKFEDIAKPHIPDNWEKECGLDH